MPEQERAIVDRIEDGKHAVLRVGEGEHEFVQVMPQSAAVRTMVQKMDACQSIMGVAPPCWPDGFR